MRLNEIFSVYHLYREISLASQWKFWLKKNPEEKGLSTDLLADGDLSSSLFFIFFCENNLRETLFRVSQSFCPLSETSYSYGT